MDDEILIEFVRENKVLYDFSHKKYCDATYKFNLWKEIGEKLQQGELFSFDLLYIDILIHG